MEGWNNQTPTFNNPGLNRMTPNMYTGYVPPAQRFEIIHVNGEAGARNFRMAPNSNALLLDDTAAIIWLAQTDGTGYLTVTPYDITPHQQLQQVDINNLATRVAQLEELVNAKSNFNPNKQSKKQRQQFNDSVNATGESSGTAIN